MIGVLGGGRMGAAVARAVATAGRPVLLGARDVERAAVLVAGLPGAAAVDCVTALRRCRLAVLAVPYAAAVGVLGAAGAPPGGDRILVDATNPGIGGAGAAGSAGVALAAALPDWRVVKAFNTVSAAMMARPVVAGRAVSVPMAGDDPRAKQQVGALAAALGFHAIDVGPIARAADLESLAGLLHVIGLRYGLGGEVGLHVAGLDERRLRCAGGATGPAAE